MRSLHHAAALALGLVPALLLVSHWPHRRDHARPAPAADARPSEIWFAGQRAFPGETIDQAAWHAAQDRARFDRGQAGLATSNGTGLTWQQTGPFNVGGRVTALESVPGGTLVYLGAADGGVFKSTNSGTNWTPIFDGLGIPSIGALELQPGTLDVLYVGTGEANASVDSYDGRGVFRTENGGASWEHLGLEATARVARIAVDPSNTNRVFVAAMGTQFSTGPHRGLYRSENRGQTWQQVLFVNDSTGVCDVVINPAHPETVYAATWERVRRQTYRRAYGPSSGIWRSIDHGATWTRLLNGLPAPSNNVGRIALAIAPSRPSRVYAQIIGGAAQAYNGLGLYRSDDGGDSWTRRDASGFTNAFGGFGWYFGDMAVNPTNADDVYCLGVDLIRSVNGGANFGSVTGTAHVDQHAIWIDPSNPARVLLGNDGGFYVSLFGGSNWTKSLDLPITQYYAGAVDPSDPARLFGGTQDNGTLRTLGGASSWTSILSADGFFVVVDPVNPNVVLSEYQYCCYGSGPRRSINGGPNSVASSGCVASDRWNWSTPIVMSPADHNIVLTGSHRVYRSLDNGVSYAPISGDLTGAPATQVVFGTISALEISPVNGGFYYAGTDDGKVWRSLDHGDTWEEVTAGLPLRSVTRLTADPSVERRVYVTLSGFGSDEHVAHIYRSDDAGAGWVPVQGNLLDVPVNDLLVDPADNQTLFAGTDAGVYVTRDGGGYWYPLGQGMPIQAVFDLAFHAPARALVAFTHGRSSWKLDLTELPLAAGGPAPRAALALGSPHPNPSRAGVRLSLALAAPSAVDASVFDVAGRRVRTLHDGPLAAGTHALAWDGRDAQGVPSAAGVYFVRARSRDGERVQRVVRTR